MREFSAETKIFNLLSAIQVERNRIRLLIPMLVLGFVMHACGAKPIASEKVVRIGITWSPSPRDRVNGKLVIRKPVDLYACQENDVTVYELFENMKGRCRYVDPKVSCPEFGAGARGRALPVVRVELSEKLVKHGFFVEVDLVSPMDAEYTLIAGSALVPDRAVSVNVSAIFTCNETGLITYLVGKERVGPMPIVENNCEPGDNRDDHIVVLKPVRLTEKEEYENLSITDKVWKYIADNYWSETFNALSNVTGLSKLFNRN